MRRLLAGVAMVLLLAQSFSSQDPNATPGVIRINVNLVQVDAVVTDSKGNPVTDLTAEDFEVSQDGRPQKIRNFEFIRLNEPNLAPTTTPRGRSAAPPGKPLRPEQVRRTIALVVDDIGLSFDSTVRSREAMKKWVDKEMQPGDLVSIVRTNAGMGAIQQFTDNKRLLYAALERVKYQPGRVLVDSLSTLGANPSRSIFDGELANMYLTASINAIRYVIAGLREIPGRKSVILFAENMSLTQLDTQRQALEDRLRLITDEANRSSVVIHAVDPRGVMFTGLTASDRIQGDGAVIADAIAGRAEAYTSSQDGMMMLTQRTGGLFYSNNDTAGSLVRVVNDGNGYYLMGYQPSLGTFDPPVGSKPRFHSISVRVTRPGLRVRSRTGFFGTPDGSLPSFTPQTRGAQLAKALVSPFTTPDIRVRLSALFAHGDKEGSYLQTMLHFDLHDIAFTELSDGTRTAEIDIAMVTADENGGITDTLDKTWRLRVEKEKWESVLQRGLVYSVPLPVKKPGFYQLRVALRDAKSKRLGSAMQFVDAPDIKSGKLALSGIVIASENQNPDNPQGSPAVRVFEAGGAFSYAYQIMNVRPNLKDSPQFDMQTQLYRENELVYQSEPARLKPASEKDAKRLVVSGKMQLTKIPVGDYVMQVTISDALKKNKDRVAVQSIDFEIR